MIRVIMNIFYTLLLLAFVYTVTSEAKAAERIRVNMNCIKVLDRFSEGVEVYRCEDKETICIWFRNKFANESSTFQCKFKG